MDKLTYGKVWPGCRLEELGNKELYCGRSFSVGGRGGKSGSRRSWFQEEKNFFLFLVVSSVVHEAVYTSLVII